jgi:two-component system response regulator HupR/HoxA
LFEEADGGTLLLDEVTETSPAFQIKLLRVLQEGEFRPLGTNTKKRVNVRVLSATNRDPQTMVEQGLFRQESRARKTDTVIGIYRRNCGIVVVHFHSRFETLEALPQR